MKIDKKIIVSIAALTILLAAIAIVYAVPPENKIPSTKTAVAGTETIILGPDGYDEPAGDPDDYEDMIVAQTWIKSGNKQLVLFFSSEAILYTKTKVRDEFGDVTARSTIQVWAEVDGDNSCTFPRSVVFADRMQTMNSKGLNETEWVELALGTTNANAFNFLALDIDKTQGHVHNVTIHARIVSSADATAEAWGALGNRTLVVNEVHLKEDSINLEYIDE